MSIKNKDVVNVAVAVVAVLVVTALVMPTCNGLGMVLAIKIFTALGLI